MPPRGRRTQTRRLAEHGRQAAALEGEGKQVTVPFADVRDRYHLASRPSRVPMRLAHGLEGRIYPLGHLILVVSSHALRQ